MITVTNPASVLSPASVGSTAPTPQHGSIPMDKLTTDQLYIAEATSRLLQAIGENIQREGLLETPARAAAAWATWTRGYHQDPRDVIKSFEEKDYDEMVIVKDIPIYSKCEHHLADIFGTATIA